MTDAPRRPSLAVVVVNFNAGNHLQRCLRSVLESSGDAPVDVVVVDNASSPRSRACASFATT
jgi:GT2 family glycosyltransferase